MSSEELLQVLDEQNPWHLNGEVPDSLALPGERLLAQILWQRLLEDEPRRFQLILGPRRVGKTTVLYQTVRHLLKAGVEPSRIWWLRLDHPRLVGVDLDQLVRTVLQLAPAPVNADNPIYLMLDELVYSESWDLWLKTFYDDRWPVRIAATSSATPALRERRLESGVGRWAEQHQSPLLLHEFSELTGYSSQFNVTVAETLRQTLCSYRSGHRSDSELSRLRNLLMLIGGFPELLFALPQSDEESNDEPNLLLRSQQELRRDAVERVVYKDIPQSFGVGNPMMMERLLYVLAGQFTGLLSPTNISRDFGLSPPTLERYISYLEQAFLVFTLPNYSGRELTVQRRGRKLYFVDGAVRNAALLRGLATINDLVEQGRLFENMAATSLRSLAELSAIRLYHWRQGKHEVDLVFDDPRDPLAFEIASSPNHSRSGLLAFTDRYKRFKGNCYIVAPQAVVMTPESTDTGIGTLPLDTFLISVGAQARQALAQSVGVTL